MADSLSVVGTMLQCFEQIKNSDWIDSLVLISFSCFDHGNEEATTMQTNAQPSPSVAPEADFTEPFTVTEADIDEILEMCGGRPRDAISALLIGQQFLEVALDEATLWHQPHCASGVEGETDSADREGFGGPWLYGVRECEMVGHDS